MIWLLLGAFVFQSFEQPNEVRECQLAKKQVRRELNKFYDSYFYELSLEDELCEGLRNVTETANYKTNFEQEPEAHRTMMEAIEDWKRKDCSAQGYKELQRKADEMENETEVIAEYMNVFDSK